LLVEALELELHPQATLAAANATTIATSGGLKFIV